MPIDWEQHSIATIAATVAALTTWANTAPSPNHPWRQHHAGKTHHHRHQPAALEVIPATPPPAPHLLLPTFGDNTHATPPPLLLQPGTAR